MLPLVTVVVPTYNRRASLLRLLAALAAQSYAMHRFEVVVVDDGSTDGSVAALRGLVPPYALRVLTQAHGGPAVARNLGVAEARGELIVFLDDDVVPCADLLATHVAAHASGAGAVVIGPMLPPADWPRPAWVRWEEAMLETQYRAMCDGQYACSPRQFYTANASLARDQFLAAGGFDARFQRAEDVELAYRLRDRGARFVFEPRAAVLHYAARTFASWCRTPYQYGRYDVVMSRDQGHEALPAASAEFHQRHRLNRLLVRACVGRPPLVQGATTLLGVAAGALDRLGAYRLARLALSGVFNLLYWQGVADELGGAAAIWQAVSVHAPGQSAAAARPAVTAQRGHRDAG